MTNTTNATAPSGPVEPLPGQAAVIPLWSDDQIYTAMDAMTFDVLYKDRVCSIVHEADAQALAEMIRDDWQADRAATAEREYLLTQERDELRAQLKLLQGK